MNTFKPKDKHLRIRITTEQYYRLCRTLNEENKTKSNFLREAIDEKLNKICRDEGYVSKSNLIVNYADFVDVKRKIRY